MSIEVRDGTIRRKDQPFFWIVAGPEKTGACFSQKGMASKNGIGLVVGIIVVVIVVFLLLWFLWPTAETATRSVTNDKVRTTTRGGFSATVPSRSGPAAARAVAAAKSADGEGFLATLPDLTWDGLVKSRAILWDDVAVAGGLGGMTDPWASPPLIGNDWAAAELSVVAGENGVAAELDVAVDMRNGWTQLYGRLARVLILIRRREREQELRRLIWLLHAEQRRMALLIARRRSEEFARRYYALMAAYLRFNLLSAFHRANGNFELAIQMRGDIERMAIEIEVLLADTRVRPSLMNMTDRIWIQGDAAAVGVAGAGVVFRGVEAAAGGVAIPPEVEEIINTWTEIGARTGAAAPTAAPVVARGAATPVAAVAAVATFVAPGPSAGAATPMEQIPAMIKFD